MQSQSGPLPARQAPSLDALAPIAGFLLANRIAGLRWAVAIATAASVAVVVRRRRNRAPIGRILPILTLLIIGRGVVGIVTNSADVYFGLGIAAKFVAGIVLLGSTLTAWPLARLIERHFLQVPPDVASHTRWTSALRIVTAIAGLYYTASGAIDVAIYQQTSTEGYVVVRFLTNWPLALGAFGLSAAVMIRQLRALPSAPSLTDMIDARFVDRGND